MAIAYELSSKVNSAIVILLTIFFQITLNLIPLIIYFMFSLITLPTIYFLFSRKSSIQNSKTFGYANFVTIVREVLLLFVIFFNNELPNPLYSLSIALILILDKVDGLVARKFNQESKLGALLDVESDSSFTLLLILTCIVEGLFPNWMIIIGCLRYIYILLLHFFEDPKENRKSIISATVSVAFIIGIIVIWTLRLNLLIYTTIAIGSLIFFTFLNDFIYKVS